MYFRVMGVSYLNQKVPYKAAREDSQEDIQRYCSNISEVEDASNQRYAANLPIVAEGGGKQ